MEIVSLDIPGCYSILPHTQRDHRGTFIKTVHAPTFVSQRLRFDFREQYYSTSGDGVLRGMHFQTPPFDHDKLVYCLSGKALDVILDLRKGSPTFQKTACTTLDGVESSGVYIPRGCAHGFLSLVADTVLLYNVTIEYNAEHDSGVLWSSIPFTWPVENPAVSNRDAALPALPSFDSPFLYGER
jgi:dTDP-4-dehydrorhamnose 3,5-epimerase